MMSASQESQIPWWSRLLPWTPWVAALPFGFLRRFGVFDDSLFLKIGELMAQGFLPYRDLYDNKPPGIYLFAAFAHGLGGGYTLAHRGFLFIWLAGIIALTYRWLGKWVSPLWASWGAWMLAVSMIVAQGYSFHTEAFAAGFAILGGMLVASRPRSHSAWLGAGLCIGVAFSFKQPALLYAAAFLPWLWWSEWNSRSSGPTIISSALFMLGWALPVATTALFFWSKGAFTPYWNCVFVMAVKQAGLPLNIFFFIHDLIFQPALFLCLAAFLVRALCATGFITWIQDVFRKPHGLFFLMGLVQLTPLLRLAGTGMLHYSGLSGFAFSLSACLLWCDVWPVLKQWQRKVTTVALCLPPLVCVTGLAWISAKEINDPGITKDLKIEGEMQRVVREHGASDQPLLVLSRFHAPRYYLLSGMKPWHPQMFFVFWEINVPSYTFEQAVSDTQSGLPPVVLLHGAAPASDPVTMNLNAHKWVRLDQTDNFSEPPLWLGFVRRESTSGKNRPNAFTAP